MTKIKLDLFFFFRMIWSSLLIVGDKSDQWWWKLSCVLDLFCNKDNLNPDSFICIWFRKEILILNTKSISTILRLRGDTDIFLPRHASDDIGFLVLENDMDWSEANQEWEECWCNRLIVVFKNQVMLMGVLTPRSAFYCIMIRWSALSIYELG